MKVKEESEEAGLKLTIQKTKIMASSPITSWQIDGEKNGNSERLYFTHFKSLRTVTAHFLIGRKAVTNLDSILKSRDITLPTRVCIVKAMVFPVIVYRCESWTIKKAEH